MTDPYTLLGIPRDASPETIKASYRRLALALHPDRHPGDAEASERFKEISSAYGLLRDPATRARYDRGEIDTNGQKRRTGRRGDSARPAYRPFTESAAKAGRTPRDSAADALFARLFRRRGTTAPTPSRYELALDFFVAALGGRQRLVLASGKAVDVTVPAGARDGEVLRLKDQGKRRPDGAKTDAHVVLRVASHPFFTRKGGDIHLEMPITLREAAFGTQLRVPTLDGAVSVRVPQRTVSSTRLRLRGKGVPNPAGSRGDQYVTLTVIRSDGDADLDEHADLAAAREHSSAQAHAAA